MSAKHGLKHFVNVRVVRFGKLSRLVIVGILLIDRILLSSNGKLSKIFG